MFRVFLMAENYLRMENILYAFWSMFWGLNGLDKFFNGVMTKTDYGTVAIGWFGVNRDDKMIHYFSRLHLPEELALFSLYGIALFEIVIGILFFYMLVRRDIPSFVQRLTFKCSMLVFFVFCCGDILFGDRMELWEHGTFMVLALITYKMYLEAPQMRRQVIGKRFHEFDIDNDGTISEVEYDQYFSKVRKEFIEELQRENAGR